MNSDNAEFFASLAEDGSARSLAILNRRPRVFDDLHELYEGFYHLSAGRGYNEVGPQPILISEVRGYMDELHLVNPDERVEFLRLLRALDSTYLRLAHERIARERERLSKRK